ncbi:hypothetical protein [Flavobacterium succinicans]|uniref:Lipoprotein n=1 Tax=Flavobacterium succinicans TaxID=29536 RepID=A0A199XT54_9FLAO|nr:hypothetical protein [Flavobacterium succinicans]OAZ04602.1 hypothetical protein FLB_04440 [Flavobacterium succinicans]
MKKVVLLFCVLGIISCKKSEVAFAEAQPEKTSDLSSFPKHLLGEYYNVEQEKGLKISPFQIIRTMVMKDTFSRKDLSKYERITEDTLTNLQTSEKYVIKKINDSLFTNYVFVDTVFTINKDNVLRKMKGYYFLNSKSNNDLWLVKKLFLQKGQLSINDVAANEDIALLEEITATKRDTTSPFIVQPTKKQFRAFIKKNGFSEGEVYLKK